MAAEQLLPTENPTWECNHPQDFSCNDFLHFFQTWKQDVKSSHTLSIIFTSLNTV